jgi:hypothetical protein
MINPGHISYLIFLLLISALLSINGFFLLAQNTKRRTPRFKRSGKLVGGIEIQERDVNIIKLVWEFRIITSDLIYALIGGSKQGVLRRLKKLFHLGYLDRPISQIIFSNPIVGHKNMVYTLGDRGADLLAERLNIDRGKVLYSKGNREVKEKYIQHALVISHFRACLSIAIKKVPGAELLFWVHENARELKDSVNASEGEKQKKLTIMPDGFFCIKDTKGEMYFFLEADRSTMSNARFKGKIRAYWHWWRQGGSKKKLGVGNFRVLTITISDQRRDNLIKTAQGAVEKGGGYMFWFCCIKDLDINKPETVLRNIWRTAEKADAKLHSIME